MSIITRRRLGAASLVLALAVGGVPMLCVKPRLGPGRVCGW